MNKLTRVQRKKIRQRRFFRIVLLIAIITLLFIFIFKSDVFIIDNINVRGNNIILEEDIRNASRIDVGNHIFNFDKNEAVDRIISFPYVKEVNIKRNLPKTVEIIVEEREAYLQFIHLSSYILIDNEGYVLEIKADKMEGIPIFEGFTIEDHTRNNILEEEDIKDLESFITDKDSEEIIKRIERVIFENEYNTTIDLDNGISVAFGPLSNVKYKLTLLNDILIHIEDNDIRTQTILMNKGENPIIVTDD